MMKRKRNSAEFKAKEALEAIREDLTTAELAKKYDIHPTMISGWKRTVIENMAAAFGGTSSAERQISAGEIEKLHARIAIMNWHGRKVLSWQLSNSMDAGFCVEALKEALTRYGALGIFNSDQGSQFTSTAFTEVLPDAKGKISMDGRGRWIDNRMIERLWRSLKYECVCLNTFETGAEARKGIGA